MKKNHLFVGALLLFAFLASPVAAREDFYVSPQGNDAWSGRLAEPNTEKTDGPFATLPRARDAMRELRKKEPNREDRPMILLRGGIYYLDEPLRITPEDSGTKNWPTEFRAAQVKDSEQCAESEKVVISAGRPITGWKESSPGRWTTTIPEVASGDWYFEQLYVNDQRRFRAALPKWSNEKGRKSGYYLVAGEITPSDTMQSHDRFHFGDAPLRADWKNLHDIEVRTFHLWTMDHLRVKEIDSGTKTVVFTAPTHSRTQARLQRGTPYRIVNVYEALSEPGEWYLDRKTGELTYLAMPGEDMSKAVIVAPRLPRAVSVEGDLEQGQFVEHVNFWGVTFAHTAWNMPEKGAGFPQAAVYLDGAVTYQAAKHCALFSCCVRHTGNYAVDFGDGCESCGVTFCELFDLGGGGVKIGPTRLGHEANEKKWCREISVFQNRIEHGGRIHPESVGVWIGHASHNKILCNEIYDFYYSAVSVGWNWSSSFSPAHHNIVERNHLHKIGQGVLDDMAGIYTLGKSPGTALRENIIHDVNRRDYGGWGIYFDACTEGIVAENNLVYDTEDGGLHQNFGTDNIVRNNVFAFGKNQQVQLTDLSKSGRITLENNIFYWDSADHLKTGPHNEQIIMRRNIYWKTPDPATIVFPRNMNFETWKKNIEPDARLEDPGFPDAGKRNFFGHRFSQEIGPKKDYRDDLLPRVRTKGLPPVPFAFKAPPKTEDLLVDFRMDENFEQAAPGGLVPDLNVHAAPQSPASVTDETGAAGSTKSLKIVEGPDAPNAWDPHFFVRTKYRSGTVRIAFDLRVEKGARLSMEARDWPGFRPGYGVAPQLDVRPDGKLFALGKDLKITVPLGQWFHVETAIELPDKDDDSGDHSGKGKTFSMTITLPDGTAKRFELPTAKPIVGIDWIGIMSLGESGTMFYLDNLKIRND